MSMEKLASLLNVDDVEVHHGKLGYALYVKLGSQTLMSTYDHDALAKSGEKHKMHALAKSLMSLADQLNGRINEGAVRAAIAADEAAEVRRLASRPLYEERGRQLQRVSQAPAYSPPAPPSAEVAVSKSMPSRFHAIVAELDKL